MKIAAYLLITISLIAGALAAATAYRAPLDLRDEALLGLELSSPAGVATEVHPALPPQADETPEPPDPDAGPAPELPPPPPTAPSAREGVLEAEERAPIAPTGYRLTPEALERLRDAGVEAVKVKQFSIARWPFAWLFGLACLGLLAGAFLIRYAGRTPETEGTAPDVTGAERVDGPDQALAEIRGTLDALAAEAPALPTERGRNTAIVDRLGELQRTQMAAIVAARPELVRRLSLGGYAEFMDRYAYMERQINRAWSAAADNAYEEAMESLERAREVGPEVASRLNP